ncbi:MAG: MFS transporter [Methyloligellaceae bacterium]
MSGAGFEAATEGADSNAGPIGACARNPPSHRPWCPVGGSAMRRPCDAPCEVEARPFVLAATILASAMAFIDGTVVHIALPAIQRTLAADFSALQWVVNIYTLFLGALILVGGALGDRIGRRRIFVVGIGLFAVASALCGLAPTAGTLIAARGLQGLGAALLVPQSLAIIAASFPEEVRGRAIGTWSGFAAIATAAGPILGGTLIDLASWRAAFWINLPVAAVAIWLSLRFVPESRSGDDRPIDILGAGLVTAGIGALTVALTRAAQVGPTDVSVIAALIAAVALLVVFTALEARLEAPMMPLGLFRSRNFSAANAITLFLYFALSGVLFLLPFNLIQVHGYSALAAGTALLPFSVVMGLFSRRAGALVDRIGPRPPLIAGPAIVAFACVVFAMTRDDPSLVTGVLPPMILLAIGMTISVAPLTTTVMNAVAEPDSGLASGVNNAASRLAGLFAVALVGVLAQLLFSDRLRDGLTELDVGRHISGEILSRANELAGLPLPTGLDASLQQQLSSLIGEAFQTAYAGGMWVCAAVAGLAALSALAMGRVPAVRPVS